MSLVAYLLARSLSLSSFSVSAYDEWKRLKAAKQEDQEKKKLVDDTAAVTTVVPVKPSVVRCHQIKKTITTKLSKQEARLQRQRMQQYDTAERQNAHHRAEQAIVVED